MASNILALVSESQALNSKIFSLPRILILSSLETFDKDGATYRELKAGLGMEDGILFSNLTALENMGYLKKKKDVKVGNKKLDVFSITDEGRAAFSSMKIWMKKWLGCVDE